MAIAEHNNLEENKYSKPQAMKNAPLVSAKHREASLLLHSFAAYACFVVIVMAGYYMLGGNLMAAGSHILRYVEAVAEALGLLYLKHKIDRQGSVAGISGMSICLYVVVYSLRAVVVFPYGFTKGELDNWAVWLLVISSLLLVLDVAMSVFKSHQKSYQRDLDVLHVKFILPACVVAALLMQPQFHKDLRMGPLYTYMWTLCLYMDVMALMPQVVMMAKSGGKIEAPLCHFVLATAFSRAMDLWFWFYNFDLVGSTHPQEGEINFSAWLIVSFHVLHLLLVVDFIYYYVKARFTGSSIAEGLSVPEPAPTAVEALLEDILV